MSTAVGATPERVWRALAAPAELVRWDDQLEGPIDLLEDYPRAGQKVRWRYRLGNVSVVLRNTLLDVVPRERIRSSSVLGLFRFDETFSLCAEAGDPTRTRLSLTLKADNSVPVVGGLLDRFAVRRMASEIVDRKLRAVQKWCENRT